MRRILFIATIVLIATAACQQNKTGNINPRAKYIFLFIGDGMGLQQVNTTQVYIDSVLKNNSRLSFIDFPVQTFATTYAATRYITCSAAAGTALSTGSKTSISTLGLNYNHTDSLFSIAKKFKANGFKLGLLTTVGIDDATPAAFYAHQGSRGSRYEIAKDLIKSGYDFFASGGFVDPYGKKLKDSVESIYSLGQRNSFAFTTNLTAIDSLKGKYKSVFYSIPNPDSEGSFKYDIDKDTTDVTLAELTCKAIQVLNNPRGFFMMVEGGKIDWACHSNDAASMIYEVMAFSDAVNQAVEFYKAHPDETLIIVTADHETGGFSLGNKENKYSMHISLLKNQKISEDVFQGLAISYLGRTPKPSFQEMLNLAKEKVGLGDANRNLGLSDKDIKLLNDAYIASITPKKEPRTKSNYLSGPKEVFSVACIDMLNRKAAIGWTSSSHTGSPVPVYVLGKGGILFTGRIDNTDIPKIIARASGAE